MPSVPETQAVIRLDLHLGQSAISKTLSYYTHHKSGSHGVFKPAVGVVVGDIWHSRNAPDSRVAIAEFVVKPDIVYLRNVNAEVRIATPDKVSFIRLSKSQTIAIRLGDIISINETLVAVCYPRPPPQPIPKPAVDPRSMRLYCSDMGPEYVGRSNMANTVGRFHSVQGEQELDITDLARNERDQSLIGNVPAKSSLFGSQMPASQDFRANAANFPAFAESQVPAANALYHSCAEVESQEPGTLKPSGSPSQSDTQLIKDAMVGATGFLQPTTDFLSSVATSHVPPTTATMAKAGNDASTKTTPCDSARLSNVAGTAIFDNDVETPSRQVASMAQIGKELEPNIGSNSDEKHSSATMIALASKANKQSSGAVLRPGGSDDDLSSHIEDDLSEDLNHEDHTGDTDLDIPPLGPELKLGTESGELDPSHNRTKRAPSNYDDHQTLNELDQAACRIQHEKSHQIANKRKEKTTVDQAVHADGVAEEHIRSPTYKRKRKRSSETSSTLSTIEVIGTPKKLTPRRTPRATAGSYEGKNLANVTTPPVTPAGQALARSTPLGSRLKTVNLAKSMANPNKIVRVCFSANIEDVNKLDHELLRVLGVCKVQTVPECDVFLIKAGQGFKRTCRTLHAIALGKTIVTDDWLATARVTGYLEDCDDYVAEDPKQEAEWGTTIKNAVARYASGCRPFKDMVVHFSVTLQKEYGRSNLVEMEALLVASGAARVTTKRTKAAVDAGTLFIGTDNQKDREEATKMGRKLYNKDLIAMGVLRGDANVEDDRFLIFPKKESVEGDEQAMEKMKPRGKRRKV